MSGDRGNGRRPLPPGAGRVGRMSGVPAAIPGVEAGLRGLEAELEGALLDAIAGRNLNDGVERALAREARAVLLRHGLAGAQVDVQRQGTRFAVGVRLPAATPRVLQVQLRLEL